MPVPPSVCDRLADDSQEHLARRRVRLDFRIELELEIDADATGDFTGLLRKRDVQRLVQRLGQSGNGSPRLVERTLGGGSQVVDLAPVLDEVRGERGQTLGLRDDEGELLCEPVVEIAGD